jgi:hypothetical protein
MQTWNVKHVLGTHTKLAGLGTVTAISVCLWLIRKQTSKKKHGPSPDSISPGQGKDTIASQLIPALEQSPKTLV